MTTHLVFVYGTLKQGFPNAGTLDGSAFVGLYRTTERFPMVVTGPWFSPVLIDEPGQGHHIEGEVFEVDDETLARLDDLELPHGYRRATISVEPAVGGDAISAAVYMKERSAVHEIIGDPLSSYEPDPRFVPGHERR